MTKNIAYITVLIVLAVMALKGEICETIASGFLLVALQLEYMHKG